MAEAALPHNLAVYEPSLFGTYSKKVGMWLFLLSDSLTFGALLYAYSYGRVSTPNWPTPFHSGSIVNATIMTAFLLTSSLTMVLAVNAAAKGNEKTRRLWLLATMACGAGFIILHARMEQPDRRGPPPAHLPGRPAPGRCLRIRQCIQSRAPVRGNFFWPDRDAHAARHAGRDLSRCHCAAA